MGFPVVRACHSGARVCHPVGVRRRRLLAIVVTCTGLALAAGAFAVAGPDESTQDEVVRVAASGDRESALLAEVLVALLAQEAVAAEVVAYPDARDAQQAIELGAVDVRPGYTGEAWLESLGRADPPGDPRASFGPVRAQDERRGVLWLRPTFGDGLDEPPANATFAFVVDAEDDGLRTVTQLAARLSEQPDARVCVDPEFGAREDGLRAVLEAYRVSTDRPFLGVRPDEAVLGVVAGDCLAGLTTATDGAAWGAGLRPLIDDLRVLPAFVPLPQVREELLELQPIVRDALQPFAGQLTTALLGGWNARVVAGEPVEQVAADAAAELRERAAR